MARESTQKRWFSLIKTNIEYPASRIEHFSTKNADTSEQKLNFSKIFNLLSQNELRATSDEKRLYFRIKRAATSNYRGSVFLPSGKKQLIIYVPIRPSQPIRPRQLTLKRSGNPLGEWTMNYEPFTSIEIPTLAHFRHFSSLFTNFPSTLVEMPLQITPFYAKQTQFPKKSNERKII